MADTDNTESLELNTAQANRALNQLMDQIKDIKSQLKSLSSIGDGNVSAGIAKIAKANRELGTLVNTYGNASSSLAQKFDMTVQRVNAGIERTGTAIGKQVSQLNRANALIKQAMTVGATGGAGGAAFANQFKSSSAAAEAYIGQLARVRRAIMEVDAARAYSGDGAKRNALVASLDNEVAAAAALKMQVEKLTVAEEEAAAAATAAAKAQAKWNDQLLAGEARAVALTAAAEKAAAAQAASGAASGGAGGLAAKFARQASTFVNYAGIAAVLTGGGAVVAQVVKLDEALHNLQGITQTSDAGMSLLRDRILEVSSASKFMASDVANAATILGQAGLSATQIGEALKAVVTFAQGAGTTLDESVNLITSAMGAFNLRADEAMAVANAFTSALNNSKLSVAQLSTGFQYSATSAAQLGMSYTELVTTMQLMADAGIKSGSMIGTGIRQILNQLANPNQRLQQILQNLNVTLGDVDVRSHGLAQVMETLKTKGFDATDAFQAFGTRGASAFIALSSQVDNFNSKLQANIGTQAALKAAETQMQSLANTARNTGAKIAAAASNGFAPLVTAVTGVIKVVGSFIDVLQALGPALSIATTAATVFAVIQGAKYVAGLVSMGSVTKALTLAVQEFTAAQLLGSTATEAFLAVVSPELLIVAAVTAAIVAFSYAQNGLKDAQSAAAAATEAAKGKYEEAKTTYESVGTAIDMLINRHKDLKDGSEALKSVTADLGQRYKALGLDVDLLSQHYDGLLARMRQIQGLSLQQKQNALTNLANQNSKQAGLDYTAVSYARNDVLSNANSAVLSSINNPLIGQLLATIKSGVPTNTQDLTRITSLLSQVRGIDESSFSSGQRNTLDRFIASVDKLTGATGKLVGTYGQGGSIRLEQSATGLQGSSAYRTFQTQIQNEQDVYLKNMPNFTGTDAVADLNQLAAYQQEHVKNLKAELAQAKKYAATNATYAKAVEPLLNQLNGYMGDAVSTIKQYGNRAGAQLKSGAELQKQLAGASLETASQAMSQARTVGDATIAYDKVKAAQSGLTKAAIEQKGIALGLRVGIDFTVDTSGNVSYMHPVMQTTQNQLATQANIEQQKMLQQQQAYQSKIGSLDRSAFKHDNSVARGEIQNDVTVLQAELAEYIRDQAAQLKTFDKYSPNTDVERAYQQMLHDVNMEVARQIDIARAKFESLKHTDHPMTPAEEAAIEAAIRAQGDDKRQGLIDQGREATLGGTRLPSSFNDAWANIQKFAEDARKTISTSVNQMATLFQDVMEGVISTVKSELQTFWTSIIEGTNTVGGALRQFAKAILESVMNTLTADLAQKAIKGLLSFLPGSLGGATKDVAETANTTAITANTAAVTALTAAMGANTTGNAAGTLTGGSGSTDIGKAGGDVGGSFFDSIGSFFSNLWTKLSGFFSQLMSSLTSLLSSIGSGIGDAASGIGDFIGSLFYAGGKVGLAGGGPVPGKLTTRDSVYKPLSPGDFIMRRTAAQRLGLPALNAINAMATGGSSQRSVMGYLTPGEYHINAASAAAFGYDRLRQLNRDGDVRHLASGGIAGLGADHALGGGLNRHMTNMGDKSRQPFNDRLKKPGEAQPHTTNVWIIKPEERPPMTKNDVIATVGEDILANGVTKKLIRSVQAGA